LDVDNIQTDAFKLRLQGQVDSVSPLKAKVMVMQSDLRVEEMDMHGE